MNTFAGQFMMIACTVTTCVAVLIIVVAMVRSSR